MAVSNDAIQNIRSVLVLSIYDRADLSLDTLKLVMV